MQPKIEFLTLYPHIEKFVRFNWHTVRLKEYFDRLMGDTRGETRSGFPADVANEIFKLSLENQAYLESIGISFDEDPATEFTVTGWELPRNF
jgi:hypothetical protein